MSQSKKIKNQLLLIFLYCQPFLDVLTSLQNHFFNSFITVGVTCRIVFLLIILILFIKEKRNLKDYIYFFFYAVYIGLYIYLTIQKKGYSILPYELKNMFHILYCPITLYTLNKLSPKHINEKHFINIYFIYLLLLVIPGITGTSFEGYKEGKTGIIGWFYATNEISAILCILMPFIFHYLLKEKGDKRIKIILFLLLSYATLNIGAKMTVITFGLLIVLYGIQIYIKWWKQKDYKKISIISSLLIIMIAIGLMILPRTSIYYNMKLHLNFLEIHSLNDAMTSDQFIDHFIFSQRLSFLKETHKNYKQASLSEKLLGIGYIENYNTSNENRKTIEMDYFDIFYRTGIIGTILFLYPFLDIIKNRTSQKNRTYQLSIFLSLFIAGFAGHVLVSPAVSIYLIIMILNLNLIYKEKKI